MGQISTIWAFDGQGTGVFTGARVRRITAQYDFAVHGGTQGSINFGGLPSGTVILGGFLLVETVLTSGGAATAGISSEGAGDIIAATVISGAPWSTTGKKAIIPKANTPESTSITLTANRNLALVVATADLTAGKFKLYLDVM